MAYWLNPSEHIVVFTAFPSLFLVYSLFTKDAEFRAWLVEERMVNSENMTKDQTKKEFARFMEDYNTGTSLPNLDILQDWSSNRPATLPHPKYYNMEQYETRMNMLRNGETLPPTDDGYDPNADLLAHSSLRCCLWDNAYEQSRCFPGQRSTLECSRRFGYHM